MAFHTEKANHNISEVSSGPTHGRMPPFLERAKKKWTCKNNQEIVEHWHDFEKLLLRDQRWSFGRLNLATMQTFQEMYCHLLQKVLLAQNAYDEAEKEISALWAELEDRMREIELHEDLSERLEQFRDFMAEQDEGGERRVMEDDRPALQALANSSIRDREEISRLRSQLQVVQSQKDQLEKRLLKTRSQMEINRDEANDSARQIVNNADNDKFKDFQTKLQDAEAELAEWLKQVEELKLANEADNTQRQKRIDDLEARLHAGEQQKSAALQRVTNLEAMLHDTNEKYVRAQDNIRELFNQCQALKGNLRVMCRIRPQLGERDEEMAGLMTDFGPKSSHLQILKVPKRTAKTSEDVDRFEMERVFERNESNAHVFAEVGQLVGSAINGRNVCIFAYGQTGSGKTHTMNYLWNESVALPDSVDYGIIPRSVDKISEFLKTNESIWKLSVSGKYVEVYDEKVYDLLRDNSKDPLEVAVKYAKVNGADSHVAQSTEVDFTEGDDFDVRVREVLTRASENRRTRSTAGNAQSSRSHSILTLRIVAERVDGKSNAKTEGLLNLIDLAGSETPSLTDKSSREEGIQINQSLTALRKVLHDMADSTVKKVSFRGSVLTKLLQSSLGDGCITMMFVMCSPLKKDLPETRETLRFAMTAQQVKLRTGVYGAGGTALVKRA